LVIPLNLIKEMSVDVWLGYVMQHIERVKE